MTEEVKSLLESILEEAIRPFKRPGHQPMGQPTQDQAFVFTGNVLTRYVKEGNPSSKELERIREFYEYLGEMEHLRSDFRESAQQVQDDIEQILKDKSESAT